jgi:L-aminopeptidase/D-esterase-like protein
MAGAIATASATRASGSPTDAGPAQRTTNDRLQLAPRIPADGPSLHFDWPGLAIGVAEYAEGPTGCTVLVFERTSRCAVDVRGGAPGTFMASDGALDALCFVGGSLYGLEAVSGVAAELFSRKNYSTKWLDIAIVRGACIFDFSARGNAVYPDKALGRAAIAAARPGQFPLGARGAGCSATVGKAFSPDGVEPAGQGGAIRHVGPTRIAVFTVVNAVGALVDRGGRVVRGLRDPKTGGERTLTEAIERRIAGPDAQVPPAGNTTLTAVLTNQRLDSFSLRQLARQVHSSLARAIQPLHGPNDGDVLFAITTGEVDRPELDATTLGIVAAEVAWDAVLASFRS